MKTFAIILSGCGVYDGSEIHEAVTTMLAIKKWGADYQIFAPDWEQAHVINHLSGEVMNETRNILVESARIARGKIQPLTAYQPENFEGIIFPGGFGAAKNLCDYAFKGADCTVRPEIIEVVEKSVRAGKKIGAECIAPVMIAAILRHCNVTIGSDVATAAHIEQLQGHHTNAQFDDVVYDPRYKVYTTPCYMESRDIWEVAQSAEALVRAMLKD